VHRPRLALALALVALAAALVGAVGPADEVRTTYAWPPATLPAAKPSTLWHTPLLLTRQRPEAISADVPCRLPPPLADAPRPATVLATARSPVKSGGLVVTRERGELVVAVGDRVLDRAPVRLGDSGEECSYRLRLADLRWSLEGGQRQSGTEGDLATMPVVTGLFSALDVSFRGSPSIEVTTAVHDVRPTLRQKLAWILAAVAIAAALVLVAFDRPPGNPWPIFRRAAARAHPADAVVAVVLAGWWVLSPAYWDDGWIAARLETYSDAGGFSTYYDVLGSNNPLGFWLDWTHGLFLQISDSLLVLRVPALLALAATWVLCRWILGRSTGASAGAGVALWALACAFLLGAFAWGMTLRPEFALALLVTGALACAVRFLERETVPPLALGAVLVPLAVLAHPAGFVALAPFAVAAPRLVRWARPRLAVAGTLVVAAAALLVLLGFVGSDLEQRRADARTFEAYGTSTLTWRDESLRYARMSEFPFATPVRRGWVALSAIAVLGFLLRRRRTANPLRDLPAAALGLALVLLIATPSKWPWHFGALIGLAAVAVGSETARMRSDADGVSRWELRPFVVVGAAMLAAAWSWSPRTPWALLDLRVLDWIPAFEARLGLAKIAFALPLVLAGAIGLVELARRGRARLSRVPWLVAAWTGPVLAVPAIAFTLGVLAADNAKADSWTLARQNLGTMGGDSDCGLAEELKVADPASMGPLAVAEPRAVLGAERWRPPPVPNLTIVESGVSPWFEAPSGGTVGVFVAGTLEPTDEVALEWGRRRGRRFELLGSGGIPAHFAHPSENGIVSWGFVAAGELPAPPAGANTVRVSVRSARGAVAVTAPVAYESEPLARRLEPSSVRAFSVPDLLMYFPCIRQPRIRGGIVAVPQHLVTPHDTTSWLETWESSPFRPLLDLYPLERRSLADTANRPPDVALFEVGRIPGSATAPATATEAVLR
jgi:hypothetical protein